MKRILLILLFTASALTLWAASTMTVQVNGAQLRDSPSMLKKPTTAVLYGEVVTVVEKGTGWIRVSTKSGAVGWLLVSDLTSTKIILVSSDKGVATKASSEEVALATKPIEKVEQSYKTANNLEQQFQWVDRMETFDRPETELLAFLSDGELRGVVE